MVTEKTTSCKNRSNQFRDRTVGNWFDRVKYDVTFLLADVNGNGLMEILWN